MLNQKTRSPQLETRAVEESFSWTPQSRKAFLREVSLLSRRAHLGAQKWAVPFRKKKYSTCRGRRGVRGGKVLVLPSHRRPKSIGGGETSPPDLGAHLWVHTGGPPPPTMVTLIGFGRGRGELSGTESLGTLNPKPQTPNP